MKSLKRQLFFCKSDTLYQACVASVAYTPRARDGSHAYSTRRPILAAQRLAVVAVYRLSILLIFGELLNIVVVASKHL